MVRVPSSRAPRWAAGRRPAAVGFVLGFLLPVPAAVAALLLPLGERVAPWLTPGVLLLRPLAPLLQDLPGAVVMLLASLANGLVAAALAGGAALAQHRRSR